MSNQEVFNRLIKTMPNGTTNTVDFLLENIEELEQQLAEYEKQIVKLRYYIRGIQAVAESSIKTHGYDKQHMQNISACKEALDATADLAGLILCDAEPVAWSEFDGEGGYDYRSYIDNEDFRDKYRKRNQSPTYFNWVEPLYKASKT
jgi:hypothetical protein